MPSLSQLRHYVEMKSEPDMLVDAENAAGLDLVKEPSETVEWIVRLERRDGEFQFRFVDRHGNINSRLSSAMRLEKEVAKQYAKAITAGHPKYKARAMLYSTMHKRQDEAKGGFK